MTFKILFPKIKIYKDTGSCWDKNPTRFFNIRILGFGFTIGV